MKLRHLAWLGTVALPLTWIACGDSGTDGSTSSGGGDAPSTSSAGGGGDGGNGTTSTTTATTTTTTASSTSSGSGLIECDEEYTNIPVGECDLLQQDCAEPDETCSFVDGGGGNGTVSACIPADGLLTIGQPCNNPDECAAGLFCIGNECTPVCCPGNDEPCQGGLCNVNVTIEGGPEYVMACSFGEACTLFAADACEVGDQCNIISDGLAVCGEPSGAGADDGDPCEFVNDCGNMQVCISADVEGDPGTCRWLCQDLSTAEPGLGGCPDNYVCNTNIDLGFDDVGFCEPG